MTNVPHHMESMHVCLYLAHGVCLSPQCSREHACSINNMWRKIECDKKKRLCCHQETRLRSLHAWSTLGTGKSLLAALKETLTLSYAVRIERRRRHVQGLAACMSRARLHCEQLHCRNQTLQIVRCATQNSSGSPPKMLSINYGIEHVS